MTDPIYIQTGTDVRIVVRSFVDDTIHIYRELWWNPPTGSAPFWLESAPVIIPADQLDDVIAALVRLREGP